MSNIIIPQNTAIHGKTPFLVTDDFVKIGNLAYPITHSFIVGEQWVRDPGAPTIIECYNTFLSRPLNTSHWAFAGGGDSTSESMTFAYSGAFTGSSVSGFVTMEYGGNRQFGWSVHTHAYVIGRMPTSTPGRGTPPGALVKCTPCQGQISKAKSKRKIFDVYEDR